MNRFQRRLHLLLWCLVGPGALAVLWLALRAQPAGAESFKMVPREAEATSEGAPE